MKIDLHLHTQFSYQGEIGHQPSDSVISLENLPALARQKGLGGLVIEQPKDKIDELKITSQVIWARFSEIDSLDMISNLFSKEAESILKIN